MAKARAASAGQHHQSKATTTGGQTYLENLNRLNPTDLTEKAIQKVTKPKSKKDS